MMLCDNDHQQQRNGGHFGFRLILQTAFDNLRLTAGLKRFDDEPGRQCFRKIETQLVAIAGHGDALRMENAGIVVVVAGQARNALLYVEAANDNELEAVSKTNDFPTNRNP